MRVQLNWRKIFDTPVLQAIIHIIIAVGFASEIVQLYSSLIFYIIIQPCNTVSFFGDESLLVHFSTEVSKTSEKYKFQI